MAPFILTMTLDQAAQARFDALRTAHFPPARLVVGAHVTLFHALPPDVPVPMIQQVAAATEPFLVQVKSLRFLGHGVAFDLKSDKLNNLRHRLRQQLLTDLTAQDRQPWQPHITIQNKVKPEIARTLFDTLTASFIPFDVSAVGLDLWIYRNGPWEPAATFPFATRGHCRSG